MNSPISFTDLNSAGTNAPLQVIDQHFEPSKELGASRYRKTFIGERHLDALLVNRASDVLIVTFHGALDRKKYMLPRFERISTTAPFGHSMLFYSDPTLWSDPTFELGWFTGWRDQEIQPLLAEWATIVARRIGASRVIFTGSSGGGFAALQVSALVPGSICLAFNPSTSIHGYLAGGTSYGTQRKYVEVLYPELADGNIWKMDFDEDWTVGLGDRMSVRERYAIPRNNFVMYADNPNDFHHDIDLPALRAAMVSAGSIDRLKVHTYQGPYRHTPPSPSEFSGAMTEALVWCQSLPPAFRDA